MKSLKIKQATKKGWVEIKVGGVFDVAYPSSKSRRGRVQGDKGDICPTITCSTILCVLEDGEDKDYSYRNVRLEK